MKSFSGTYSTKQPNLIEYIKKCVELIKEIDEKDPIKAMLKNNGFSPEKGDFIVSPEYLKPKNFEHPNIIFSRFCNTPMMCKKIGFNSEAQKRLSGPGIPSLTSAIVSGIL